MSRLRTLVLASAVLASVTCGDGATEPPAPVEPPRATTIVVNPAQVRLAALDAAVQLTAEVRDQNGQVMAGTAVTWSSNNAGVAEVDATGLVTAVGNGTATIAAATGSVTGSAAVLVEQDAVALSLTPEDVAFRALGDTLRLVAEGNDANGHPVKVTWSSSDAGVAQVDASGLVTAAGNGTATITATAGRAAVSATVTVEQEAVTLTLTPEDVAFRALGDTLRLVAGAADANGYPVPVDWSSSDTAVAQVDTSGLVTAAGNGTATITATAGRPAVSATVTVEQEAVVLRLTPEDAAFRALGDTLRLVAEAADANGHPVPVAWSSSETAVAQVDDSGLVTAVGNGTATITAKAGGAAVSATVSVEQEAVALSLTPEDVAFRALGDTIRLLAEVADANGHPVPVTWSSSETAVAQVDDSGLVTAVGNGTATITAKAGEDAVSATVTVDQEAIVLRLTPEDVAFRALGDTLRLVAEAADANGYPVPVAWSSSDPAVAQVDASGLVTAVGNGTATITAKAGEDAVTAAVTVEQEAVVLGLTPEDVAFRALGDTLRLVAEAADANGYPVPVAWSSRDPAVAQVDASGLVTAASNGTATITAKAGGDAVSATVTVDQEIVAISGLPPADTLLWYGEPGDTLRLVAVALDANGHPVEGARFGWSSSLAWVATVDAGGLVRGAAEGVTTITATANSVQATTKLTVVNRDRAALVALYHATGGPNWERTRNWLTGLRMRDWEGVTTRVGGNGVVMVTGLWLPNNNLTGPIPPELWTLTSLERLVLYDRGLTGTIPPEVGNLTGLEELTVDAVLTGPIPPEIGNLADLEKLWLGHGNLSGPIPPEIGNLTSLEQLALPDNALTGTIPPELGRLASLQDLTLGNNTLSGTIPPWLGSLGRLRILGLNGNSFVGPIPPELANLERLEWLFLGNNALTGSLPPRLGSLEHLTSLSLADNLLTGPIPPELGNLARLEQLLLDRNALSGTLPPEIGNLTRLERLLLDRNRFSGPLPETLTSVPLSTFWWNETDLCSPPNETFQRWLQGISDHRGGRPCPP